MKNPWRLARLQQAGPAGRRQVDAGRVVAARLDRQEADLLAAEQRLEGVDVEALGVVSGRGCTRVPIDLTDSITPMKVGDSQATASPGRRIARAARVSPWRAPLVTIRS